LLLARTGWIMLALVSVGLFVISLPPYYAQVRTFSAPNMPELGAVKGGLEQLGIPLGIYPIAWMASLVLLALVFIGVGVLIFWRKSDDRAALFFSSVLVVFGAIWPNTLPAGQSGLDLIGELISFYGFMSFLLLGFIFPDGRFVPHWTRWVALIMVATGIGPELFPGSVLNANTWPAPYNLVEPLQGIVFVGTLIFAQVYRYRRVSTPVQRQQTKWFIFSLATALVCLAGLGIASSTPLFNRPGAAAAFFSLVALFGFTVPFMFIPIAIGIAVLRYRLWDIDPIINRTLVYSTLTACVSGLYVLIVGYLGVLFRTDTGNHGGLPLQLIATGVVAVLFQPLRERLQRGVNRLMYGERDEPYAVLSRLGQRLEATLAADTMLLTVVETVREALKLPYAAIALSDEARATNDERYKIVAASGAPVAEPLILPLVYQHETVGQLMLAPRVPGEAFSPADRRLFDDLARHTGIAVHAVRLTHDLQHSRERLVTTREEERRRLRRDLHDGLGPTLASLTMKLDIAQTLMVDDPQQGVVLLAEIQDQMKGTLGNVRRLVYALRPPVLDQFGLVAAIREHVVQHTQVQDEHGGSPLQVVIDAPEQVPPLPAAVEVAAYYIAVEALTNVVRHAHARRCWVRLTLDKALNLEVVDDGDGPPQYEAGVGLQSMRERAAELGGVCVVEPAPNGGTRVWARLSLGN
jgi:signal transduction histidine kinase